MRDFPTFLIPVLLALVGWMIFDVIHAYHEQRKVEYVCYWPSGKPFSIIVDKDTTITEPANCERVLKITINK